jgi:hypothetical protein
LESHKAWISRSYPSFNYLCVCVNILRPAEHVLKTRVLGESRRAKDAEGFRPLGSLSS